MTTTAATPRAKRKRRAPPPPPEPPSEHDFRAAAEEFKQARESARYADLFIRDLFPHPRIQRAFRPKHAQRIRDNLDPNLLGELCVVEDGGKLYVFDGQHRLWALREYLGENQKVPCRIYKALPDEQLADMFLGISTTKALRAIDSWRMAVIAKHQVETLIDQTILPRHKLIVTDQTNRKGGVRAVTTVKDLYVRFGEEVLDRVLAIPGAAWQRDPFAYDGQMLRAVAQIVTNFNGQLDDRELAQKLARSGTADEMIVSGRSFAKATGCSLPRGIAIKMLDAYNKGRRRDRLVLPGHDEQPV